MKKFSVLAVLFLTSLFSSQIAAADLANNDKGPDLRTEILNIISDVDISQYNLDSDQRFTLEFMVNEDAEIVVLKTSSPTFDKLMKTKLNYKSVESSFTTYKKYIVPIVVKK